MNISPALLGLFGIGDSTASLGPSETLSLYRTSVKQADKAEAAIRKDPAFTRDIAMLQKAIAKAKTPEDLLKDPRATEILLQGLGLGDQAGSTGLARKALLSDPKDKKSLAAALPDARWMTAAKQLDLAASGLARLRDPATFKTIVDGVAQYRRITKISSQSQAVADALYIRNLPDSTPGIYSVLGDTVMRRVATTIAGLPPELAVQPVESQARSLTQRFDIKQFGDPKQRDALIQRYLVTATAGNISSLSFLA